MGGGSLFLPCVIRLPPFRRMTLPRFFPCSRRPCSPVCANARPSGVRAPLRSRSPRHASHLRRRASFPRFPSALVRSATLRAHPRKPAPLRAPLRSARASLAGEHGIADGRTSRLFPLPRWLALPMRSDIRADNGASSALGTTGAAHRCESG